MLDPKQNFLMKPKRGLKESASTWGNIFYVILRVIPYLIVTAVVIFIIIVVFIGLSLTPHYAGLKAVYGSGKSGANHLQAAEKFLTQQKFDLAEQELGLAATSFNQAQQGLTLVEEAKLFKNDYFNNQLVVAQEIIEIGEELSLSLQKLTGVGEEVLASLGDDKLTFSSLTSAKKRAMLAALYESQDTIAEVKVDFEKASETLQDINRHQPMFLFNSVIDPLQKQIPQINSAFDSALTFIKAIPAFAGYPAERTYLVLFLNNREMRPSGGFIGTYGILTLQDGEIKRFFTDNSYNLDWPSIPYLHVEPPAPIKEYLKMNGWFFRDSNWSPDFPTAAQKAEWFYQQEGGLEKVNGVIALTPTVIEDLLGLLGEFTVDGLTFNQENFFEQLEYQVEFGYYRQGIPESDRKDIIGDLGEQIIAHLFSLPLNQWTGLLDILEKEVKEKQVMFYFHDPRMQYLAIENEWAGQVKETAGDYVMLIDANLAALKTDDVISRTMAYELEEQEDGSLVARTKVNYQHTGGFDWKTTRYQSYSRLYVPEGSELISVTVGGQTVFPSALATGDEVDVVPELGKTSFGLYFKVEPQTEKEVVWKYRLPVSVEDQIKEGEYKLLVQKQPGITKMNLQLDLNFAQKVKRKQDLDYQVDRHKIKHVEVLRSDQEYTVWLE